MDPGGIGDASANLRFRFPLAFKFLAYRGPIGGGYGIGHQTVAVGIQIGLEFGEVARGGW